MNVVELEIGGNDKQDKREGYNKIKIIRANETKNGITFTNNGDGSCTLNGTNNATGAIYFNLNLDSNNAEYFTLTKNKKYYMYLKGLKTGTRLMARSRNEQNFSLILSDEISKITEWTKETATDGIVFIKVSPGTTFNNETFYPMLAESETELPYEPYGAMPSPEFQSEVDTVGSNINFVSNSSEDWELGSIDKGQLISSNTRIRTKNYVDIKNSNEITFKLKNTNYRIVNVHFYGENYTYLSNCYDLYSYSSFSLKSMKLPRNTKYVKAIVKKNNDTNIENSEIEECKLKIEQGTIASEYSSYNIGCSSVIIENSDKTEQQTKTVDIQQEMLEGDYFIKEEDGWKEVHVWNKKILDGTENVYGTYPFTKVQRFDVEQILLNSLEINDNKIICSHFKSAYGDNEDYEHCRNATIEYNDICIFYINKEKASTKDEFKNWLTQKYNEGNPVYVWYKLETPLKLACTEKQIEQLDDLLNTSTYKNVTHIYSTDKVSPVIKVVYKKDLETMLNNQKNEYDTRLSNIEKLLSTTTTSALLLDNLQTDLEKEVM